MNSRKFAPHPRWCLFDLRVCFCFRDGPPGADQSESQSIQQRLWWHGRDNTYTGRSLHRVDDVWDELDEQHRPCWLDVCLTQPDRNTTESGDSGLSSSVYLVIQSRVACTPPRRKPLESDFETIKLISNGAYGWVRKTSLYCGHREPNTRRRETEMKACCIIFVFPLLLTCKLIQGWGLITTEKSLSWFPARAHQYTTNCPLPVIFLLSLRSHSFLSFPVHAGLCFWCATKRPVNDLRWRRSTGRTWSFGTRSSRCLWSETSSPLPKTHLWFPCSALLRRADTCAWWWSMLKVKLVAVAHVCLLRL